MGVFLLAGVLVWFVQQSSGGGAGAPGPGPSSGAVVTGSSTPQTPTGPSRTVTSSPPAGSERDQAVRLEGLLERTSADRMAVVDAVNDVLRCGNVTADAQVIEDAGIDRDHIADELTTADFSRLPNSAALLSSLGDAMRASAAADREYAQWARNGAATGCSGSVSTDDDRYRAGDAYSKQASVAKDTFVGLWNPVATSHRLRTWQAKEL